MVLSCNGSYLHVPTLYISEYLDGFLNHLRRFRLCYVLFSFVISVPLCPLFRVKKHFSLALLYCYYCPWDNPPASNLYGAHLGSATGFHMGPIWAGSCK